MAHSIIESVQAESPNFILSTSFGRYSAVLLKIVTDIAPNTPVIWVDSGYNTAETYLHCEQLRELLSLNLHIYHPERSVTHRTAIGVNPLPGEQGYEEFVREIKLEPFKRALDEQRPSHWLTGIRADETEHRRALGARSSGPDGIEKVAPLYYWEEVDLIDFLAKNNLPLSTNYRDIAKPRANQECGLHCRL